GTVLDKGLLRKHTIQPAVGGPFFGYSVLQKASFSDLACLSALVRRARRLNASFCALISKTKKMTYNNS
ncbi:MAG: hypothetical protein AAF242_12590, partial [Bacteroidota bacterium]